MCSGGVRMAAGPPAAGRSRPHAGGQARWWRALLQAQFWLALALGFLVGRAPVLGALGPFPAALLTAVRGGGLPGVLPVAAGAVLGLLSRSGANGYTWPDAVSGVVGLVFALFWAPRLATVPTATGAALLAALPQTEFHWLPWLGAGLQAAVAGALALVLWRGGRALAAGRPGAWDGDTGLAGLLLAMGLIAGLDAAAVAQSDALRLPVDALVAGVAVMAAAWTAGPLAGGAAGLLAGLAGLLATGPNAQLQTYAFAAMAFGVAGLLAGAFRDLGRTGVVIAYVCSHLVVKSLQPEMTPAAMWAHTAAAGLAAAALFAVPRRWAATAGRWVLTGIPAARPLPPAPPPPASPGAASKTAALARVLREVQQAFTRPDRPAAVPEPAAMAAARAVGLVVDRVCEGCRLHGFCWGREKPQTLEAFEELWQRLGREGSISVIDIPDNKLKCIHPRELVEAFNHRWDHLTQEQRHRRQMAETRLVLAEHVQNLARIMEGLEAELAPGATGAPAAGAPRLAAAAGVARLAKRGSLVSGDSSLTAPVGAGRYLVALSDGMGAGREAARESQRALELLHGLLLAGYRPEPAVQTTNLALALKQATDWFATLDVAVLDLHTGRTDFLKLGAAPALIKRGHHVQIIRTEAPPAGILGTVALEPELRVLRPGDYVVLVSDGLWDRGRSQPGDGQWLAEYLATHEPPGPGALAEAVLARALEGGPAEPGDDMTVVAVQVEAAGAPAGLPNREPVPVRRVPRTDAPPPQGEEGA